MWKVPAGGGEPVQVTKQGGGSGVESPDGKFVYYLLDGAEGGNTELRRVPVDGGEEVRIVESACAQGFDVAKSGIYFFSSCENPSAQRFNFATRKVETVAKVEGEMAYGFAVSPDSRWLLYSAYGGQRGQSNLMMVEKFR
jgi:hypothetical protein